MLCRIWVSDRDDLDVRTDRTFAGIRPLVVNDEAGLLFDAVRGGLLVVSVYTNGMVDNRQLEIVREVNWLSVIKIIQDPYWMWVIY